jgi:putative ABC transport system substrate-binding protein
MDRRQFMVLTAAIAVARHASAQESTAVRVGVLIAHGAPDPFVGYLRDALQAIGYTEGRNLQLLVHASADQAVLADAAAELVRQKVNVIATVRASATQAAKKATTEIPIVIALAADAVGLGLVASLAKPGGNVTGVSANSADTAAKTLEILRELLPQARRIVAIADGRTVFSGAFITRAQQAGKLLGFQVRAIRTNASDLSATLLPELAKTRPDAVILQPALGSAAAQLMLMRGIIAVAPNSTLSSGCLMTYSAQVPDMFRKAARYIDRIVKGARPAELPVEQPTRFELIINQKAARALGVSVPQSVLLRADRIIG